MAALAPDDIAERAESAGRLNPDIELQIVGEDHLPLPTGETGLIRSRGPQQSTEIFGMSADDPSDVLRDGWFYPGDIGRQDDDGFLYLVGRRASLIVRRGVSIYPEEVEAVINGHPAVHQSAVCGLDGAGEETEVAALVVAREPMAPVALRQHCVPRLNSYMLPDHFLFVSELPRTGTGKIHRAELANLARQAMKTAR